MSFLELLRGKVRQMEPGRKAVFIFTLGILMIFVLGASCNTVTNLGSNRTPTQNNHVEEDEDVPNAEETQPAEDTSSDAPLLGGDENDAPAEEAAEEDIAVEDNMLEDDPWGYIVYQPGEEITLGVSSALSGGFAIYGEDMVNGVEFAIADFGGELEGWEIVVVGGDDDCDGAAAVAVAQQFAADQSVLGVVGPLCSGAAYPASEIYAENNMIMITPSSTVVALTEQGYENIFRTVMSDVYQAEAAVSFLREDLGVSTLGVIHDQSVYGEGIAKATADKFEEAGGAVVAFEAITMGDTDFSEAVTVMMANDPDAIYFGGMSYDAGLLINQLRMAGFEGVFIGPDGIQYKPGFIDTSGGAAEGSYATASALSGVVDEGWEARFTEIYGDPVAFAPGSYDAATIILQAAAEVAYIEDGNLVIPRYALVEAVHSISYDGVTGYFEFSETGDLRNVSVIVFQVVDGDFEEIKTFYLGD